MTILVKICGVTSVEALDAAIAAGADAVGFVFHEPSPRHLTPERAAKLARRLPRGVLAVAVTLHPEQADVDRVLDAFLPDAWQSDEEDFDRLRLPESIERWPVLRRAADARPLARRVLFDAPVSGSGQHAHWNDAEPIARQSELILCGGLAASNVAQAIAAVRPFGVDVSSGVERAPGIKDCARIRAFIHAARAAAVAE